MPRLKRGSPKSRKAFNHHLSVYNPTEEKGGSSNRKKRELLWQREKHG